MTTVSPVGTPASKDSWSTLAVTQGLSAARIADIAPTSSIHFITFPPWTEP